MPPETIEVDRVRPETRGLMLVPSSINEEQRTVEYVLATEEPAPRYSWRHGEFDEVLLCGPENIDTTRIERGVCPWLLEHNRWDPKAKVGTITGHRIENRQLIVTVRYDQTDEAEETFQRVRRGELPAASAGYVVEAYDVEERDGRRDLRKATRWSVYEGSIVTVPADHNASQRSGNQGNQQEVEVRLRRRGAQMPPEDNDGPQQGTRSSQSPPSQPQGQGGTAQAPATGSEGNRSSSAGETAQPPVQQRQAQAPPQNTQPAPAQAPQPQDGARTASLEFILGRGASAGLTAQEAQEMATRGLTEAQVVDDLFARLRQRSGPDGSNTHRVEVTTEEHVKLRQVAEGVILNRIDNAAYPLEGDAVGSDLRGRSLLDIGERIQARMGRALAGSTQAERAAELLGRSLGGALTPSDFPLLLGNVTNRTLQRAYEETPGTFGELVREVPVNDFREVTRVRMGDAPELETVSDTGEYTNGAFAEAGEKFRIYKMGKIVTVSREAIMNDDIGIIARIPSALGARARNAENVLVYGILLSNPNMADGQPLFSVAHGNVVAGQDLDEDGLEQVFLNFAGRTGLGGHRIRVMPKNLVCAPTMERKARKQLVLPIVPGTTAETNPYLGKLGVVVENELMGLSNTSTFFVFADPRMVDTIEFAYLNGHRKPYVESQYGFRSDGLEIKIRHEIGAKAIDHVGMVMVTP